MVDLRDWADAWRDAPQQGSVEVWSDPDDNEGLFDAPPAPDDLDERAGLQVIVRDTIVECDDAPEG
jgi:hypothetical protein